MTPPPPTADAARAYAAASASTTPTRRNPDARLTAHGQDVDATALVAVVDVLVVKALEAVGKRVVRADRARFNALKGRLLDAYVTQVATHGVPHRLDRLVAALRYVLPENALIRTPSLNRASLEEVR